MASEQDGFPSPLGEPMESAIFDDEMMRLLFPTSGAYQPATQTHMPPSPAQQWQGNEAAQESAQAQSQFSAPQSYFETGNLASAPSHNTVPATNPWQTTHLNLEPAVGSYFQRPEVAQAAAQAQRFNTALANASIVRNGKRYLKPWIESIVPMREVEMLTQKQLDNLIGGAEQTAEKLLDRFYKQRAVFDMLDGLTPQQSNDTTREVLLQKAHETIGILMSRTPIQLQDFIEAAESEAEQKKEAWFVVLLAHLIRVCLELQYVFLEDTSIKEYYFEENYYKKRCCELEAWKAALNILGRAGNEEIQRLDRRVGEYLSGRFMPSEFADTT